MTDNKTRHELRCFCRNKPMLAQYGIDEQGQLYVHIKIYKSSRIYGEIVVREGKVELRCRECYRWHRIRIIQNNRAVLEELREPPLDAIP